MRTFVSTAFMELIASGPLAAGVDARLVPKTFEVVPCQCLAAISGIDWFDGQPNARLRRERQWSIGNQDAIFERGQNGLRHVVTFSFTQFLKSAVQARLTATPCYRRFAARRRLLAGFFGPDRRGAGAPRRSPSVLRSSSISGQWMP